MLQFLNAIFQSLQIWYKSTDSNVQCRIYIVYSRVEWFTVEHGHYAANHLNMLIWPRARGAYAAKFSLSKTHRILKNKYIFVENLQIPFFYFQEQSPEGNAKLIFFAQLANLFLTWWFGVLEQFGKTCRVPNLVLLKSLPPSVYCIVYKQCIAQVLINIIESWPDSQTKQYTLWVSIQSSFCRPSSLTHPHFQIHMWGDGLNTY